MSPPTLRFPWLVLCLLLLAGPAVGRSLPAPAPVGAPPPVLRVATWECYFDPARPDKPLGWAEFERQTGAVLDPVVFATNDDILRAMRAGGFDLCVAACDIVPALISEGLLRPLPVGKLTNYRGLLPELRHVRYGRVEGRDYCAPFSWGEIGLAYDSALFPQPPQSWQILWDPAWRGRTAHWDDISVLWTAALAKGQRDVFALSGQTLWEAARWAARLCASDALLWRDEKVQVDAMASGRVALSVCWPSAVAKVNKRSDRRSGRWAVAWPEEGVTGFIDNVCVAATSKRPDLAYAFADILLSPDLQLAMCQATDFAPVSAAAIARLSTARRLVLHLDDPNRVNRLYLWRPIANRAEYERLWIEARSGRLLQ